MINRTKIGRLVKYIQYGLNWRGKKNIILTELSVSLGFKLGKDTSFARCNELSRMVIERKSRNLN